MKTFRFAFFFSITIILTVGLSKKFGSVPPLGQFLSPFHGFLQNAEKEGMNYEQELEIEGLSNPVSVYYDELRIPHIYAENAEDLHFVQGYITARDRLWQMDFFSRLVLGRLSEVVGERALDYDRLNRRIGLKDMTYSLYDQIQKNPELNAILNAYSKGVNAYIDQMSYGDYPLEFKLLNYEPEAWSPLKSCLAYAMLSNTLSRSEADLENTNAYHIFGPELYDILFPEQLGNLDPVIPNSRKWDFEPIEVIKPNVTYPNIPVKEIIQKPNPLNGSNNFAVMGSKSNSGNVLLANEPDLSLTLPSIWYAYHLHAGNKNVMGVTVPGTPVILIGFNDSISWGVTNSPRDQVDWYSVKFKDSTQNEYWYNDQWFKTEKVVEEFEIDGGETFVDTIVKVHHGPVVYGKNFHGDSEQAGFAMKWMAHIPSTTFAAMNKINQANNYDEFVSAMKQFSGPPQNFIFGSSQGNIALWLPGTFPIKWDEQGKFLMDGSDPSLEYSQDIPFDHLMWAKNPEQGYLTSANQHPVSEAYPYYTYDHHYEYYRNRRINDRLRLLNNVTPDDMKRLQNDNYNYIASESLPFFLANIDTLSLNDAETSKFELLQSWDYFSNSDSRAATVFQIWSNMMYRTLWDEFDTITVEVNKPNAYTTTHLLKTDSSFAFSDILSTPQVETTADIINLTFKNAVDSVENWAASNQDSYEWYEFKNTHVNHLLGLNPFSVDNIEIGGYSSIVNAASGGHGPSWRMVVELDPNGTKAWGVYPGSQTGNPGSPLYGHMIDKWAAGEYFQLLFGQDISGSNQVIFTQTISPK